MKTTFKKAALGSLISAISLSTMTAATSANAAPVPYQFAGQYEFSNCTDNVEGYVAVSIAAGTLEVNTDNGDVILDANGFAEGQRIPFPVTCDANGQLQLTTDDMTQFQSELEAACDTLFPPDDSLSVDLNEVLCPVIEAGIVGIVNRAQATTPQFIINSHDASVSELTGGWDYYRYWLFGAYDGLVSADNVRNDGLAFNKTTPIQSYGRVRTGRNILKIEALGGLRFADDALACGYGYRDEAKQYYYNDYLIFNSEFRHGFECLAQYNDQTVALEIAPIYKAEYRMDKVQ